MTCRTCLQCYFMIGFQTGRFCSKQKLGRGKKIFQALNNRKSSLCYLSMGDTAMHPGCQQLESPHLKLLRLSVFSTHSLSCSGNVVTTQSLPLPLRNKSPLPRPHGQRKQSQDRECTTIWQVLSTCWYLCFSIDSQQPRSKSPGSTSGCVFLV